MMLQEPSEEQVILVVEDDAQMRIALSKSLAVQGHPVVLARLSTDQCVPR